MVATEIFEQIGVEIEPVELAQLIKQAMARVVPARGVLGTRAALPPAEAALLERAGMSLAPRDRGVDDPIVRAASAYAALLLTSLTVSQAARKLGVDPSRIRHRLADRTLYGIRLPSEWRLPVFQFADGQLVPGISRVLPRLSANLHPLVVFNWFTSPNTELVEDDEEPLTPIDWLMLGRNPEVVADLAEQLGTYA